MRQRLVDAALDDPPAGRGGGADGAQHHPGGRLLHHRRVHVLRGQARFGRGDLPRGLRLVRPCRRRRLQPTRLRGSGLAYRRWALEHPTQYMVMFGRAVPDYEPSPERPRPVARVVLPARARWCSSLAPGDDAAERAYHFWATLHGYVMLELAGMGAATPRASPTDAATSALLDAADTLSVRSASTRQLTQCRRGAGRCSPVAREEQGGVAAVVPADDERLGAVGAVAPRVTSPCRSALADVVTAERSS